MFFDVLGKITQLRDEREWSTYRLAKCSGVPQSTIATWYGQSRVPSLEDIEKLCRAFEISLSDFFNDYENEKTSFRRRREELGLSIEEIAAVTGIDSEIINAYDLGTEDITKAQFRVVKKLATALSCTTDKIT